MAKQSKAQLIKSISDARDKLDAIEKKEKEKTIRPLVGKCFKYRNSYGSDENWWLYKKILSISDRAWLNAFMFQKTSRGNWEIHFNETYISLLDGYISISEEEFNQAWKECLNELSTYNARKVKK